MKKFYLLQQDDEVLVYCPLKGIPAFKHNGQRAKIIDFGRKFVHPKNSLGLDPGIYLDKAVVKVRINTSGVTSFVFGGHLKLDNEVEDSRKPYFESLKNEKLYYVSPLPDTPFKEGDLVHIRWDKIDASLAERRIFSGEIYRVVLVNYLKMQEYDSIYAIRSDSQPPGCFAWMSANELELINSL